MEIHGNRKLRVRLRAGRAVDIGVEAVFRSPFWLQARRRVPLGVPDTSPVFRGSRGFPAEIADRRLGVRNFKERVRRKVCAGKRPRDASHLSLDRVRDWGGGSNSD